MNYKAYNVTVTPKETTYCGSWVSGEYTEVVYAKSASAAITAARQERLNQEGRYAPKVTYKAKLAQVDVEAQNEYFGSCDYERSFY